MSGHGSLIGVGPRVPCTVTSAPLARLLHHGRAHRTRMWWAAACSVLNKVFDLAPPLLIGVAIDIVVERDTSFLAGFGAPSVTAQLWILGGATIVIWGLESIFEYAYKILWRNLAQTVQHEMRLEAYSHVQGLEMAWFEDRSTGGLMAVLNDDINQLERFLDIGANELLQVVTTSIVIGGAFFWIAPSVAWMGVLPMPFILWGSVRYQRLLMPRYASVRNEVDHLNSQLANNLAGIATIKAFTSERHESARLRDRSDAYREANRGAIRFSSAFSPLIRMVIVTGFTGLLVFGGLLAVEGSLEVGAYAVLVFLTQRLLWPLTRLGETFDLYQRAMASTTRVLDLLGIRPQIVDGGRATAEVRGRVTLERVSFRYHRPGGAEDIEMPVVLDGVNIDVPPGETIAIVGATGSGKSTIVKLVLRFYDATEGAVRIDGVDVREMNLVDLRAAIGLVSQDVFLFHGTVRENICYGRRDASMEAIVEAAKIAEAHRFIEALPRGYDTIVGERGQKLSGGQRQRVSIARAVLKDPPILVLDEATSSVDNETEAAIQRSLARIAVGRTTILIAHRLSTVRNADRIYVLDGGRVVESGRHDLLAASDGLYSNLWKVQTGQAVTHLLTGENPDA